MGSDPAARITSVLRANPKGIGITKIARIAGMHRAAAAKHLELLRASGHVEMRKEGMTKLYSLSHRVPLSAMLDFQDDILVVIDDRGRIVQANERYEAIAGLSRERITGTAPGRSGLPIVSDPEVLAALGSLEQPEVIVRSCRVPGEDTERSFRIRLIPTVFDHGGTGVTVIGVDISREREISGLLAATETRFQAVLDLLPDLVCRFRPDHTITLTNRAFREWFGNPAGTGPGHDPDGSSGNRAGNGTGSPAGNSTGSRAGSTPGNHPAGPGYESGNSHPDSSGIFPSENGTAGPADTCAGRNFLDLVYGDATGDVQALLAALPDSGPAVHVHRVSSRDRNGNEGPARWIRWHYIPEYDTSGALAKIQATGTEVTGEKLLEGTVEERDREIAFLSRKASEFALLPPDADIRQFIAEGALELVPGAIVAFSSFDRASCSLTVRTIAGDREGVFRTDFKGSIGLNLPFPEQDTFRTMSSGRLIAVPGGIHVLTFGRIPPMICSRIERKIHWKSTWLVGLIGRERPLGCLSILKCTEGPVERPDILVAYCRVAALALQERLGNSPVPVPVPEPARQGSRRPAKG